ncbi:hypothetical protein CHARACLAT_017541 [Characodon lateralis]|uniref:Uncharacterized protein n=1 Tax=Characodon lateralis TaxID=208331 RepID=A0ABU7DHG5_9TELE|nr:hypothetical protein [Characodon lateralis]
MVLFPSTPNSCDPDKTLRPIEKTSISFLKDNDRVRSACIFNQSSSKGSLLRTSSHGFPALQLSFDPPPLHLHHLPSILLPAPSPS